MMHWIPYGDYKITEDTEASDSSSVSEHFHINRCCKGSEGQIPEQVQSARTWTLDKKLKLRTQSL